VVVSLITASLLYEEMKYTLLHCCDKTIDDRMALFRDQKDKSNMKVLFGIGFDVLFSELYKIMVNKVTFLDFRVVDPLNQLLFRGSIGYKNALF